MDDYLNVAAMTPVLHYTMGGFESDAESCVLSPLQQPIPAGCSPPACTERTALETRVRWDVFPLDG